MPVLGARARRSLVLGPHLAHTSVGIGGYAWLGLGNREVWVCRSFLPFRARAYPALPIVLSLDKEESSQSQSYWMCIPLIALAITSCWISEVPSKMS